MQRVRILSQKASRIQTPKAYYDMKIMSTTLYIVIGYGKGDKTWNLKGFCSFE